MRDIYATRVINAGRDRVWGPIRRFTDVRYWFPDLTDMHIKNGRAEDRVGAIRAFLDPNGQPLEEQLVALSDREYHQAYRKLTLSEGIRDYVGHLRLRPVTESASPSTFVEWWVDLEVEPGRRDEVVRDYSQAFERGLKGLEEHVRDG